MEHSDPKHDAFKEIKETLNLCSFFTHQLGISYVDDPPNTAWGKLKNMVRFIVFSAAHLMLIVVETSHVVHMMTRNPSVAEFVGQLHLAGYGWISFGKMAIIWYKRSIFKQLVQELSDIWPVQTEDKEATEIKEKSLSVLRSYQLWYVFFNQGGVMFYALTPIALHLYHKFQGHDSVLGFVWPAVYPYDKHKPINHALTYIFESFAGQSAVWFMLSTDLVFTALTSHISMLLCLLQLKIRRLGNTMDQKTIHTGNGDCLEDIVACIKIHQRLIKYFYDLEDAFSFVNLINTLVSSIDICCVIFVIALLEPWMEISNKLFLGAAVTQMGILCWYADDLARASTGVADAVYESGWYRTNTKCRRYLLRVLQRSQKPLYYTAMKFNNITMRTYASILTTAYSYFALLYTMYNNNDLPEKTI